MIERVGVVMWLTSLLLFGATGMLTDLWVIRVLCIGVILCATFVIHGLLRDQLWQKRTNR